MDSRPAVQPNSVFSVNVNENFESRSVYMPPPSMPQPSLAHLMMSRSWGGVGGFASPAQPSPPLCAPPLTIASSLGNPQMPSTSTYNTHSSMEYNSRLSSANMPASIKRKAMEDVEELMPATKQYITEDKVAASLDSLHLSSQFQSYQLGIDDSQQRREVLVKDGSDDSDSDSNTMPRLFVHPEVNKIPTNSCNALPEVLLKNIKKEGPCLEVVLWQPPTPILPVIPPVSSSSDTCVKTNSDNANLSVGSSSSPSNIFSSSSRSVRCASDGNTLNSPDSGVSISPPSNSAMDIPCEMEEDCAAPSPSNVPFSGVKNPYSLFYTPEESSTANICNNRGRGEPERNLLLPGYADRSASAYMQSWLESNNNTAVDLSHITPLPSSADDGMDL